MNCEYDESVRSIIKLYDSIRSKKGEFIKMIESYRNALDTHPYDTNINHVVFNIQYQIKEYFPLNGVPDSVIDSLAQLQYYFKEAEDQLNETLDIIIEEVKKIDEL